MSPVLTILLCLGLSFLAWALIRLSPFRVIDPAESARGRYASLDGLRGFLAFGVFIYHLQMSRDHRITGSWLPPGDIFYSQLGPLGVSLFFMITGFLFWDKLLRSGGRPDWRSLYLGRLFRIGPMYLVAVLAMLLIVFSRTGFTLQQPLPELLSAVGQWLALGMIDTQPDVNGYPASQVLAGVTWTIWYEWWFYAALLGMSLAARGARHVLLPTLGLLACIIGRHLLELEMLAMPALFAGGMLVASMLRMRWRLELSDRLASMLALAILVLIFAFPSGGYGSLSILLLIPFFYLLCCGCSLFGLLHGRGAQRLGHISYSLYLLQGLVLTLVFENETLGRWAISGEVGLWFVGALCGLLLVLLAALAFCMVERPGIQLGQGLRRSVARARALASGKSADAVRRGACLQAD